MRSINWYIDEAKENGGFPSDRALGRALEVEPTNVSRYRAGKCMPSPENMVKLARFAEVPREIALADLGMWMNFDTEAKPVYERMAEMAVQVTGYVQQRALIWLVCFGLASGIISIDFDGTNSVQAADQTTLDINYTNKIKEALKRSIVITYCNRPIIIDYVATSGEF